MPLKAIELIGHQAVGIIQCFITTLLICIFYFVQLHQINRSTIR